MLEIVAAFVIAGVVGCLSAMAGQAHERRRWERRLLERSGLLDSVPSLPREDRMARLEQAVDAMAIELERIGEGQRYVTRLLADRESRTTPRSPQPGAVRAVRPPTA